MIKLLLIIFFLFLANCEQKNLTKIQQKNNNITEEHMIKYVTITWKINDIYIVNLPKQTQEQILKNCGTKKFTLIKIDTQDNGIAKGKFRCG